MCSENEFEECIYKIKRLNKVTDLLLVYKMDNKHFIINDKIEEKLIKTFFKFSLTDFKKFLSELNKMDLWESDYELELRVIKY